MKKIVLALIASVLAVSLMATTAGAKRHAAPPTLKAGTLIVGLTPPAPGFQVGTTKGTTVVNPKGMEIDLAKDIAEKLGLKKIEWYNQSSFPKSYAPGPKPYDLYFGEETITPERSKNVDYSIPYIDADQGAMVRKGLSPLPKSIADLKKLTLCAQAGTTGAAYIKAHIKPTKAALYPSTTSIMFQQLISKQCDVSIYDIPILGSEARVQARQVRPDRRPHRHARAVRHRLPEGQQAARGRESGPQGPDRGRHRRQAAEEVADGRLREAAHLQVAVPASVDSRDTCSASSTCSSRRTRFATCCRTSGSGSRPTST